MTSSLSAALSLSEDYGGRFGILKLDEVFDFSSPTSDPPDESNHCPIWTLFFKEKGTNYWQQEIDAYLKGFGARYGSG